MTNTELRKAYENYSAPSDYRSRTSFSRLETRVLPRPNGIVGDTKEQEHKQEQEQQEQQQQQTQQQHPQHQQQSARDLFHDAEEVLTPELNDGWNPKLNYETIFDKRIPLSPPLEEQKTYSNSPVLSPLRGKTRNIFLTVDFKDNVASDSAVLPASPNDSKSSWLKTRTRGRDEIPYGSKTFPSRRRQDDVTERFSLHPISISTNNEEGSATDNYCTNSSINKSTVVKDLTTLSPIASRANVSTPTKSILRTPTNAQQTQPHQPKFVSFANILHTECTISVSPECLRRSVRRNRSARPRSKGSPTATYGTPIPPRTIPSPPSDEHKGETKESTASSEKMKRVLVLLMDPASKQYELTSIHFPFRKSDDYNSLLTTENERCQPPPPPVQLGSILKLIRKATTHRPLKLQRYIGFCRPIDGREMINTLTVEDNAVREDEILIAIPKGYVVSECAEFAKPILRDVTFQSLVEKLRKKKRMRRRKTALMAEVQKIERESALSGGWGVGDLSGRWGVNLLFLVPVLLLLWTFASIGLHRDGCLYLFNGIGLIKHFTNALVDDIDTGI